MARARNIKPGFFTNDLLAEAQPLARILFAGLWCFADREGRLHDRPKKIRAEILPYDQCDADELLKSLESLGFIVRYEVNGVRFIQVLNFDKHQNPHVKEQASEIPAPCKPGVSPVQVQCKPGESPEVAGLIPSSLIPDPLIPQTDSLNPHPVATVPEEFEVTWAAYPKRPGASKADSLKAWRRRIKNGVDPQTILSGVMRYAEFCRVSIDDPQYIKQPATFFGTGEHYLSDWTPQPRASPRQTIHDQRAETIAILTGQKRNEHSNERDITGTAERVA